MSSLSCESPHNVGAGTLCRTGDWPNLKSRPYHVCSFHLLMNGRCSSVLRVIDSSAERTVSLVLQQGRKYSTLYAPMDDFTGGEKIKDYQKVLNNSCIFRCLDFLDVDQPSIERVRPS